MEESKLFN